MRLVDLLCVIKSRFMNSLCIFYPEPGDWSTDYVFPTRKSGDRSTCYVLSARNQAIGQLIKCSNLALLSLVSTIYIFYVSHANFLLQAFFSTLRNYYLNFRKREISASKESTGAVYYPDHIMPEDWNQDDPMEIQGPQTPSPHSSDNDSDQTPRASKINRPAFHPTIREAATAEDTTTTDTDVLCGIGLQFADADPAMNEKRSSPFTNPKGNKRKNPSPRSEHHGTASSNLGLTDKLSELHLHPQQRQKQQRTGRSKERRFGGRGRESERQETMTEGKLARQGSPTSEQWQVYDAAAWERATPTVNEQPRGGEGSSKQMVALEERKKKEYVRATRASRAVFGGTSLDYEKGDVMEVVWRNLNSRC